MKRILQRPTLTPLIIDFELSIETCNKCGNIILKSDDGTSFCTCPSGLTWS